jgi:hypothetical protein
VKQIRIYIQEMSTWFLLLALIPVIYLIFTAYSKLQELDLLEERLEELHQKQKVLTHQRVLYTAFFEEIKNADHFYIDKHLETLLFLEPERRRLQVLPPDDAARERMDFLQNANRLLFAEENIQQEELFQEMEERQQRNIDVDENDLKQILCLIEGVSIPPYRVQEGRPQLIIQSFDLIKKSIPHQGSLYSLNLHLLKREGTKR